MSWQFVSLDDTEFDQIMTLDYQPGRIASFFGAKPERIQFVGNCTVWHRLPNCTRESTPMESMLSDFWTYAHHHKLTTKRAKK